MHRHLLLSLLAVLLFCACSGPEQPRRTILQAEALCDSLPDSALTLLESVDPRSLHSRADKALYALILSRALDRCDSIIASDSIIAPAVDYFTPERDPLRHAMTAYYLGRTYFNADELSRAVIAYYNSYNSACSNHLTFWAGMAARELGTCFNKMGYFGEEYKYDKIAFDAFSKIDRKPHSLYALLDVGLANHNLGSYDSAAVYLKRAVDSAIVYNDQALLRECRSALGKTQYALSQYSEAISTLQSMQDAEGMTATDSAIMALSYMSSGHQEKADVIIERIRPHETDLSDFVVLELQKKRGDYISALNTMAHINDVTEQIYSAATSNNVTGLVADYYNELQQSKDEKLRHIRFIFSLSLICLVLTIISAALLIKNNRQKSRNHLNDIMRMMEDLEADLKQRSEKHHSTESAYEQLIRTKYDAFNRFYSIFERFNDNKISQVQLVKSFDELIDSIAPGSEEYASIESVINNNYNNVVSNLRKDLPNLKEKDYALFVFTMIGIPIPTISMLLKETSINNVYNRKKRLKLKIAAVENERSNEYLTLIS